MLLNDQILKINEISFSIKMNNIKLLVAFILCCMYAHVLSEFTNHFRDFLINNYGNNFEADVERMDMGTHGMGSFGGKENDSDTITKRVSLLKDRSQGHDSLTSSPFVNCVEEIFAFPSTSILRWSTGVSSYSD